MKRELPFPAYLPDQSVHSGVSRRAKNVYVAADGYRPVGALSDISDALDEPFLGGQSFTAQDGTTTLLAGTGTNLYKFGSGNWTSLRTGLSAGRWHFQAFGNFAIAVNGSVTRFITLSTGVDAVLAGAPTGNSICLIGDYLMIGGADGNELKVQWSAFDDHTGWTDGVNQAGSNIMLDGGEVMGLAGGEYGLIFQRQRIVRVNRTGDPDAPLAFDEITNNFGCASKASIATEGRTTFWLSDRGFMAIDDGQGIRPIGSEKVDRTFQRIVSRDDYERIWSAIDPVNKIVAWGVPGTPGIIFSYNWEIDRWSTIETPFTGMFAGYSASLTLEEVSAIYPNLDTMPYSLDDDRFKGGSPKLYMVDGESKLSTFSGPNLKAEMGIGFTEFTKGNITRMRFVRPVTDATSGMTVTFDSRDRLGDGEQLVSTDSLRKSGAMPVRCSGRYISPVLCIEAGATWKYCQGLEFDFAKGGER